MPDIREILEALPPEDKQVWSHHRTEMRRSYLTAHNMVLGVIAWDAYDDAFIDLIDIKLAILFERAGKFNHVQKQIIEDDTHIERVEKDIEEVIRGFTPKAVAIMGNEQTLITHEIKMPSIKPILDATGLPPEPVTPPINAWTKQLANGELK